VEKKDTCPENAQKGGNNDSIKGKDDLKEEREDPAAIVTFEPHQMMVTMTVVKKTMMSESLDQITRRTSGP